MKNYILAIDQGTTGSTALLVDENCVIVAKANVEFPQHFPKAGWVEHQPSEIWRSVKKAVDLCCEKAQVKGQQIQSIGITNQRETLVVWDRDTGEPLIPAIVWQCKRSQGECESLKKKGYEKTVRKKTGLVIDPYFTGSKILWAVNNHRALSKQLKLGQALLGTIDAYLIWKLTGGAVHATDVSNASRTLLMNISTMKYDEELLKIFKAPEQSLPEIKASSGEFGKTKGLDFLPDGIPISGVAGDQQAALFGQACFKPGDVKVTYGTGSFILMNIGKKPLRSKSKLLTTVAWQLGKQPVEYAYEGGVFICGAAVQWLRDQMQFINSSEEIEKLVDGMDSSDGVVVVPAFSGLGAPHWKPKARGAIMGITRGTTPRHIAYATLEAMALQNVEVLTAMKKDSGRSLKNIKVDGGASNNNKLMQMQSDFLGHDIVRPRQVETTALGAAFLSGLHSGFWSSQKDILDQWQQDRDFHCKWTARQRKEKLDIWNRAIIAVQAF